MQAVSTLFVFQQKKGTLTISLANREGGSAVTQCSGNAYCCGGDNCDCNTGQNVIMIPGPSNIMTIIDNPAATVTVTYQTRTPSPSPKTSSITKTMIISPTTTGPASPTTTLSSTTNTTPSTGTTASPNTVSASTDALTQIPSTGISTQPLPASTQTGYPTSVPDSNNVLKIGLGLGIPLGVLAIAVIVYLAWRHGRHQRKAKLAEAARIQSMVDESVQKRVGSQRWDAPPQELPPGPPGEMMMPSPQYSAWELPAGRKSVPASRSPATR